MLLRQKTLFIAAMISLPAVVILFSCNKSKDITPADPLAELNLPDESFNYSNPLLPNYFHTSPFTSQDITTPSNPVTDWGATLGRVLFYDKNLSLNKTISCASCHKQNLGFSDNQAFSKGFAGGLTARNSMSLVNVRYYLNNKFFWDERAGSLAEITLPCIV
jgi:cytochrome c peroxidase